MFNIKEVSNNYFKINVKSNIEVKESCNNKPIYCNDIKNVNRDHVLFNNIK